MSFYKKSFDFFGKMNNNKNFYVFNTTSSKDSSDIISKIEKYENTLDFFKHYTNIDIKNFFKSIQNLDNIYSSLYSENNINNFNLKIDRYISALSNIYLLSNLISKNKLILNKAIDNAKKDLNIFCMENKINKNIHKKLNNYISNLLGIEIEDKKNKIKMPISFKIEKSNICIINGKGNNINIEHSINNSSLNQEKTRDITHIYNTSKITEENFILDLRTPSFPKNRNSSQIINDNNDNNDNNDKLNDIGSKKGSLMSLCNKENDELNKNFSKKESIHSLYTLASKSKFKEEKVKGASSKFNRIIPDEIINRNNINNNLNSNKNIKRSSQFLLTSRKRTDNNLVKNEIKNKKQNFSSTNLKSSNETKMYKDLLIFINNLFKKEIINSEEKIKLKQLIIVKSDKLENIYGIYYPDDKDTLIIELKNLIK